MKKLFIILLLMMPIVSFAELDDSENIEFIEKVYGLCEIDKIVESNDYLYVVGGFDDMPEVCQIIDNSTPSNPTLVSTYTGHFSCIAKQGNYAYLGEDHYLEIIDVSNPQEPTFVSRTNVFEEVNDIRVVGSYAYLGVYHGLEIVDITSASDPQIVSYFDTGWSISKLEIQNNMAIVGQATYGLMKILKFIDISDRTDPSSIFDDDEFYCYDFDVEGTTAYLNTGGGIVLVDYSNPLEPEITGSSDNDYITYGGGLKHFDGYVYCIYDSDSLSVYDVGDVENIEMIERLECHRAKTVFEKDSNIYICGDYGIKTISTSNPQNPDVVGYFPSEIVFSILTYDDLVIASTKQGGLVIYRVDENGFTKIGQNSDYVINKIGRTGDIVIAGYDDHLVIYDISNPANPVVRSYLDVPFGFIWDVVAYGDYAYCANCEAGLLIVDVSSPDNPQIVDNFFVDENEYRIDYVRISESTIHLYSHGGVHFYDVADQNGLQYLGEYPANYINTQGMIKKDNNLYFTDYSNEALNVVDVSDFENPVVIATMDSIRNIRSFTLDGPYIILAEKRLFSSDPAIKIIDIHNLDNIQLTGYYYEDDNIDQIEIIGNLVVAMSEDYMYLSVYDCSQALGVGEVESNRVPATYSISCTYPNPFNPSLNVGISLPQAGDLKVQVYNINGQLVQTLTDGRYTAGEHNLIFNGNGLSSGVYFINAVVPGEMNQTRKVTLVK